MCSLISAREIFAQRDQKALSTKPSSIITFAIANPIAPSEPGMTLKYSSEQFTVAVGLTSNDTILAP